MRQNDSFTNVIAWQHASRIIVLGLLFLSGIQFLGAAVVYRSLGKDEGDKLIFAGCLLFAGLAFATAFAFRRSGAPTWKHKIAVAVLTLPAASHFVLR